MASGVEVLTARPVQGVVMTTVVRLGGWGVVSVHRGQLTLRALGVQGGETPGPRAIREGFWRKMPLSLTSKFEQVWNKQRR